MDYEGIIFNFNGVDYTWSFVAEGADESGCSTPMSTFMESYGIQDFGPGITMEMVPADICPFVYRDICQTCASGNAFSTGLPHRRPGIKIRSKHFAKSV